MLLWAAAAWAASPKITVDRVDILSENPALWLTQELPRLGLSPRVGTVRFLAQVQPVIATPWEGLHVGLSLQAQSVLVERILWPHAGVAATGGLITRYGLPNGGLLGMSWRPGKVRLGASAVLLSSASWARPAYTSWRVLPGLGLGFGRDLRPRAPWM